MEIFSNKKIQHGPLEAAITTDEEVGCLGAKKIAENVLKGKYLLNLDNEDITTVCIGCAGGTGYNIEKKVKLINQPKELINVSIIAQKFKGGHSGADIAHRHINAIKEVFVVLSRFAKNHQIYINEIHGGDAANAIPSDCVANFAIKKEDFIDLSKIFKTRKTTILDYYQDFESDFIFELKKVTKKYKNIYDLKTTKQIISAINSFPDGVREYDEDNKMMSISTNFGKIDVTKDGQITFA